MYLSKHYKHVLGDLFMTILLREGAYISLDKEVSGLKILKVGLGWEFRQPLEFGLDLDVSAFLLGAGGQVARGRDFVFYNNHKSYDGSVELLGDTASEVSRGDLETLRVDLTSISSPVQRLVFALSIHDGEARSLNLGQLVKAHIRLVNQKNGQEIARFFLAEEFPQISALIFGEIYRDESLWNFRVPNQGVSGGLQALARGFGVKV
jgi:tellurium resistance protein TerD